MKKRGTKACVNEMLVKRTTIKIVALTLLGFCCPSNMKRSKRKTKASENGAAW